MTTFIDAFKECLHCRTDEGGNNMATALWESEANRKKMEVLRAELEQKGIRDGSKAWTTIFEMLDTFSLYFYACGVQDGVVMVRPDFPEKLIG